MIKFDNPRNYILNSDGSVIAGGSPWPEISGVAYDDALWTTARDNGGAGAINIMAGLFSSAHGVDGIQTVGIRPTSLFSLNGDYAVVMGPYGNTVGSYYTELGSFDVDSRDDGGNTHGTCISARYRDNAGGNHGTAIGNLHVTEGIFAYTDKPYNTVIGGSSLVYPTESSGGSPPTNSLALCSGANNATSYINSSGCICFYTPAYGQSGTNGADHNRVYIVTASTSSTSTTDLVPYNLTSPYLSATNEKSGWTFNGLLIGASENNTLYQTFTMSIYNLDAGSPVYPTGGSPVMTDLGGSITSTTTFSITTDVKVDNPRFKISVTPPDTDNWKWVAKLQSLGIRGE